MPAVADPAQTLHQYNAWPEKIRGLSGFPRGAVDVCAGKKGRRRVSADNAPPASLPLLGDTVSLLRAHRHAHANLVRHLDAGAVGHPLGDDFRHAAISGYRNPPRANFGAALGHADGIALGLRAHFTYRDLVGLDLFTLHGHAHRERFLLLAAGGHRHHLGAGLRSASRDAHGVAPLLRAIIADVHRIVLG